VGSSDRARVSFLAEHTLLASGRRLGDRYALIRPLGHGGMAVVWLASDERLGRQVAIKVLSDAVAGDRDYARRFGREARLAARVQHPNLVQVYDFDTSERPYLVMEYIEGGTLARRFADGTAPEPEQLARELLSALRHIHANGVLHRDVKPHNVLIDANGHARLTDFGIAQPSDATSLTEAGHVIGTESYMAPEVRAGDPASERSDLFATGTVLAEAAREGAGAALWSVIDQLRDPVPTRRPTSATAALAMLERAETPFDPEPTERLPPRVVEAAAPTPPKRGDRSRLLAPAALAAVLLALAAVALASLLSGDDDGGGSSGEAATQPTRASQGDQQAGQGGGQTGANSAAPSTSATPSTTAQPTGGGAPAGTDGASLNQRGYDLIQAGSYDAALPVLQRAVDQLEGSGDQLTYGYALYNLAHALRLAGRPEEAIPLLEQRLQIPDQLGTVEAELSAARADAGATGAAKAKPEKPESHGHGPPPWAGAPDEASGGVEGDEG
jgi:eukaryotic-like serine/threonine-protein kinase